MEYVSILITLHLSKDPHQEREKEQKDELSISVEQPLGLGRTQGWGLWAETHMPSQGAYNKECYIPPIEVAYSHLSTVNMHSLEMSPKFQYQQKSPRTYK